ncbi:transglutaminase domain-containing protein [Vibrio europaeus]|uniref:Transglutaminase-like domain-containing protein n=1 Tax=Vibrio europaeus TaxID=300876 RepID=A0A178J5C6_9VIBR|nr:transglutaminase domain-containing protein [Vibrio europaeus]MDC5706603.1 hypothetical protein [Vibrio europaeus]MDC5711864.1 hypothetical protein [Vibrio europaeus]MDC5716443.1 hypothetical protein [Vibrio europaeus]MDC5726014.1 hypothetical protein [Vibrio europaeus]MDC5733003.1 hypothetical protein [Vibrio europaeus]
MINYAAPSPQTQLNEFGASIGALPAHPRDILTYCHNVIENHNGQNASHIAVGRLEDYRYRSAYQLFQVIRQRGLRLDADNPFEQKIVGNCQTLAILALALLRHQGIPARMRFALCTYYQPGRYLEQVVIEYWQQSRWRLLEPALSPERLSHLSTPINFSLDDVPRDKSVCYTDFWQGYRRGKLDLSLLKHQTYKKIVGFELLIWRTLQDLLALHKRELYYWDHFDYTEYQIQPDKIDRLIANLKQPHLSKTTTRQLLRLHRHLRIRNPFSLVIND